MSLSREGPKRKHHPLSEPLSPHYVDLFLFLSFYNNFKPHSSSQNPSQHVTPFEWLSRLKFVFLIVAPEAKFQISLTQVSLLHIPQILWEPCLVLPEMGKPGI